MCEASNDPRLEMEINADRTVASVVIPANFDPTTLNLALMEQIVCDTEIVITPDIRKRMTKVIEDFQARPRMLKAVIAEASKAVNGEDGRLEWEEAYDLENFDAIKTTKAELDDEAVNYYDIVSYIQVEQGTHVATLLPPTDGIDGLDVCGKTICATPGKTCDIIIDSSLDVDPSGKVIAAMTGVFQYRHRTLKISQLLEIEEYVDFSTGNIDFEGSVHVKEGVRDCFVVKATEKITIDGLIEAATIMCGGDFVCRRGMAARDRGHLIVDGNASTNFLNNVRGRVKGDLNVKNELINCEFAIGGNMNLGQGSIIGGRTIVTGSVKVEKLGSDQNIKTTLVLGAVPILAARLIKLKSIITEENENLENILASVKELNTSGGMLQPGQQERITELSLEESQIRQKLSACELKSFEIRKEMMEEQQLDLQVGKIINTNVHLIIGVHEMVFRKPLRGPIKIFWSEDQQIRYRQADGEEQRLEEVSEDIQLAA